MVYDDRHPLSGHMDKLLVWQIRERLRDFPPTLEQIRELADEEKRRRDRKMRPDDRSDVWRLLDEYKKLASGVGV